MYDNGHRKFDARGRLCVPKHIREVYQLENAKVEVFTENDLIIIRKVADNAERTPRARSSAFGSLRIRGTSDCNFCICSSCIGFRCPWAGTLDRLDVSGKYKIRCEKCSRGEVEPIHDCDFFANRRAKRFYRLIPAKKLTNHGLVMRELREIKKMFEAQREAKRVERRKQGFPVSKYEESKIKENGHE
jgi:hypothetical protein